MKPMMFAIVMMAAFNATADTEIMDGIEWTYTVNNGKASVGSGDLNGARAVPTSTKGAITIPSVIGGCPVTSIGECAFRDCSGLTNVTIPEGVTSIGWAAFMDCGGMINVTMPGSVTSIGSSAFSGCNGLTSITIPKGVTSIDWNVFNGCSGLTRATIPAGVTSIGGYAFYGCRGLTSVTIPESVTSIDEWAFSGCTGLGDGVVIRDDCVLTVNGTCPTEVAFPEGTRLIAGGAFAYCGELTNVMIPASVTSIGRWAFSGCEGLGEGVVIRDNCVLTVNGTCPAEVNLSETVRLIADGVFEGCCGQTHFVVDEANRNYKSVGGLLLTKNEKTLIAGVNSDVTIPEGVTSIGTYAFFMCTNLTSVVIPDDATSIGDDAFAWCNGLTSVTIPNSVTNIGRSAFWMCTNLASVTIPKDVTKIEWGAFDGCSGLTSITIPEGVTDIGYYAFECCSGLTNVVIPVSVTSIGHNAFYGCSGLTSVTIPSKVTSIDGLAFYGCDSLATVYVENGDAERVKGLYNWGPGVTVVEGSTSLSGPTPTPEPTPEVEFDGSVKRSFDGLVYDASSNMCGIMQIATAKATAKGVKVSGFVMLEDGKKQTIKAATKTIEKGKLNVSTKVGKTELTLTITGDGFTGTLGEMTVASETLDENTGILSGTLKMSYFDANTGKLKTKSIKLTGIASDGDAVGDLTVKGGSAKSFVTEVK